MVVDLVEQDLTRFTVIFGNRYHLHFIGLNIPESSTSALETQSLDPGNEV
jgi:hypothetical protein